MIKKLIFPLLIVGAQLFSGGVLAEETESFTAQDCRNVKLPTFSDIGGGSTSCSLTKRVSRDTQCQALLSKLNGLQYRANIVQLRDDSTSPFDSKSFFERTYNKKSDAIAAAQGSEFAGAHQKCLTPPPPK